MGGVAISDRSDVQVFNTMAEKWKTDENLNEMPERGGCLLAAVFVLKDSDIWWWLVVLTDVLLSLLQVVLFMVQSVGLQLHNP